MKKYRTTKKYQNGGTTPGGKPKPGTKPAAKATGAKKPTGKYMTEGEAFGAKLKKGDYTGAAKMVGEAFAEAPRELYGALKRSLR